MRKLFPAVGTGVIVFAVVYISQCYLVSGFRIKLEAEPVVYFVASIRHMMLLKSIISLAAVVIAGWIFIRFKKKRMKTKSN